MKWIALGMAALLVGLDQYFKFLAEKHLADMLTLPLLQDVFHLTYLRNDSLVFGMGGNLPQEQKNVLMIVTSVLTALLLVALIVFLMSKKVRNPFLIFSIGLILGGGIGNLIDRMFRHYVIDYLDFRLINFYVFNFADCCVVIGTIMVMGYILFFEGKKQKKELEEPVAGNSHE